MIYGQDWSSYQSATPSTEGLAFAFVKATEGLGYVNPRAASQITHARGAGLTVGWYHYPHIANSASAEADYFLAHARIEPGDLIALDWEWYGQKVSADQARAYKQAWLARVKLKMAGHRVGLYVDRSNWTTVDRDSNCGDFLWIADPTTAGHPRVSHAWTFHQYGSNPVDKDAGNFSDAAALRAWATGKTTAPAKPPASTEPPKETDVTITQADALIVWNTDHAVPAPTGAVAAKDRATNPTWRAGAALGAAVQSSREAAANTRAILAGQAALTAAVTALRADGGITVEQLTAAAKAGAAAALAELGHTLADQSTTTPTS